MRCMVENLLLIYLLDKIIRKYRFYCNIESMRKNDKANIDFVLLVGNICRFVDGNIFDSYTPNTTMCMNHKNHNYWCDSSRYIGTKMKTALLPETLCLCVFVHVNTLHSV